MEVLENQIRDTIDQLVWPKYIEYLKTVDGASKYNLSIYNHFRYQIKFKIIVDKSLKEVLELGVKGLFVGDLLQFGTQNIDGFFNQNNFDDIQTMMNEMCEDYK